MMIPLALLVGGLAIVTIAAAVLTLAAINQTEQEADEAERRGVGL